MITNPNRLHWFHSAEVPLPQGPGSILVFVAWPDDSQWSVQPTWSDEIGDWFCHESELVRVGGGHNFMWWAWLEQPIGVVLSDADDAGMVEVRLFNPPDAQSKSAGWDGTALNNTGREVWIRRIDFVGSTPIVVGRFAAEPDCADRRWAVVDGQFTGEGSLMEQT